MCLFCFIFHLLTASKSKFEAFSYELGLYSPVQKKLRVVDLPGHERLRLQMLDEHKGQARSVHFFFSCCSLSTLGTTEHLYIQKCNIYSDYYVKFAKM